MSQNNGTNGTTNNNEKGKDMSKDTTTTATNNTARITAKPGKPDTTVTTTTTKGKDMSDQDTTTTATTGTETATTGTETETATTATETATTATETATETADTMTAAERARANMANARTTQAPTGNPSKTDRALSKVPTGAGIIALQTDGTVGEWRFNKSVSHVSWFLSAEWQGKTELNVACNRIKREVQIWCDNGTRHLFTLPGFFSDAEALRAIGFEVTA